MKGIEWLVKLVLSALITSAVCIASTFWAVSTYADMILTQYNLKSAVGAAPGWSQFVAHLSKQAAGFQLFGQGTGAPDQGSAANKSGASTDRAVAGAIDADGGTDPLKPSETGATGGSTSGTDSSTTKGSGSTGKKPPEDAVAVFGHQNGQSSGSGSGLSQDAVAGSGSSSGLGSAGTEDSKRIVVSGEEFTKKKEQLSNEEKNKIFNMLVTRVPQTEMQTISRLMEDGITAAELKQIEQLLQTYLKPEEYTQLLGMIKAG